MIKLFTLHPDNARADFLERDMRKGVCASMANAFCYNELYDIDKPGSYYQNIWNFTARHRAYKESIRAKILHPMEFIRQGDGLAVVYAENLLRIELIRDTLPGVYIIVIKFVNKGSSAFHSVALTARKGCWFFLDPNFGLFKCNNGIDELIYFLKSKYTLISTSMLGLEKGERFPIDNTVLPRFWNDRR